MPTTTISPTDLTRDDIETTLMVGMEIHVELATRSKMWSDAPNVAHPDYYDAPPNTLTDPVVLGMPGTLPVMNKAALEMAMRVGLALNCEIAPHTKWDRKSYYYPDQPKNYQISQYDQPLCAEGYLDLPVAARGSAQAVSDEDAGDENRKRIRIIRAHLEEDAGKLLHEAPGGGTIEGSIVDLNRAGTPLLEIVTYPDFTSADQCVAFARLLRDICRHLGVSEGVMQRGHVRFEPNINVHVTPAGPSADADSPTCKTPIVEIKNLNSFKALHDAVAHERERQVEAWCETGRTLADGGKSTRGWDAARGVTVLQREKEQAHDYRYFPDPDLVAVTVDKPWRDRLAATLPELPHVKRQRYQKKLGLSAKDTDALLDDPKVTRFFEAVLDEKVAARRAATLLLNSGAKRANERGVGIDQLGVTPGQIKTIAALLEDDKLSSSAADELFGYCCQPEHREADPEKLAQAKGLLQVSDAGELEGYVADVLADPKNETAISDIRGGKEKAVGALLGQIMKKSRGQANPKLVREMILKELRG